MRSRSMVHPPGGSNQSRPHSVPKTSSGLCPPNLRWISSPPASAHPPPGRSTRWGHRPGGSPCGNLGLLMSVFGGTLTKDAGASGSPTPAPISESGGTLPRLSFVGVGRGRGGGITRGSNTAENPARSPRNGAPPGGAAGPPRDAASLARRASISRTSALAECIRVPAFRR